MTLQQLEYVISLYRFKHFAKAAEHCKVSQPTLSSMIHKLEEEFGLKIFDRNAQPIAPTPTGKLIIEQAWRVLKSAEKIKDIIEEERSSLDGTFHIGILPTISPYLIPRFFPQMMQKYPRLDLRVTEMKTAEIRRALLHGDIDAGIMAQYENLEKFEVTHLFYEQFFGYVSKNDALFEKELIRTSDLKGEFLWLLDEGHCFREQLVKFCQLKGASKSQHAYTLGSIETFMRIVENGKGVTFIPELAVYQLNDQQKQHVRPFAIPIPSRDIIFMTGKNFIRHHLLNLIKQEIQGAVPKNMLTRQQTQHIV
ncbi:MAG: LysR substrate-binding domain-containing protein [Prevotella sp.]|nr:LysR substrate-binding domain-containing protein [Prevotella sp.]